MRLSVNLAIKIRKSVKLEFIYTNLQAPLASSYVQQPRKQCDPAIRKSDFVVTDYKMFMNNNGTCQPAQLYISTFTLSGHGLLTAYTDFAWCRVLYICGQFCRFYQAQFICRNVILYGLVHNKKAEFIGFFAVYIATESGVKLERCPLNCKWLVSGIYKNFSH